MGLEQSAVTAGAGADDETASRTAESPRRPAFYRPQLDWLRFLAFAAVFVHHALPNSASSYVKLGIPQRYAELIVGAASGGAFGVDLFFALSAFLITELLIRERDRYGAIDVRAFYMRRILRIWPLYYAFLILAAFVLPPFGGSRLEGSALLSYATFFGNWFCAFNGYPGSVADPLWSVSIEEQFYLSWPILIALIPTKRIRTLGFVLLAMGTVARVGLILAGVEHPGIWCNTFARLDPIALGTLLATAEAGLTARIGRFKSLTALAGLLALALAGIAGSLSGPRSLVTYPVIAVACCALVLVFLSLPAPENVLTKVLAYLGKISYGLYVFHVLALAIARQWLGASLASIAVGGALTLLFSVVSYHLLEEPFLKLKKRFTRVQSRPEAASL